MMDQSPKISLPWQQPNATELYAAESLANVEHGRAHYYYAFPWATWIDRAHRKLSPALPQRNDCNTRDIRITVCQHIWALEYSEIFVSAGITDLFWSHATKEVPRFKGLRLHPFPLYPVRCATHPLRRPPLPPLQRPLLYSFQGAYASNLYLTQVRDWLLKLPPRKDGRIEQRREWHYEQAIYREQILGQIPDANRHAQLKTEADAYATTLQNSWFAICPSGSGPNSIRLWEALGYGAIPVILSDHLELPGSTHLWKAAAVFVQENESAVANLPRQLEALTSDHQNLLAMQQAGQQLWRRYGLNGFVHDIIDFHQDPIEVLRRRALKDYHRMNP